MSVQIDIQVATDDDAPDPESINSWLQHVLSRQLINTHPRELSVRIVDSIESRELNARYRQQDKPTNVLAFPTESAIELPIEHLGDIVICAEVVNREAQEQNKTPSAHWAHMCIHGVLHLLGYDHVEPAQAEVMECLETEFLAQLNFPAPYAGELTTAITQPS